MKFHLPKKLLAAVLAAMTIHTTEAGYYTIGDVIGVDENGVSITATMKPSDVPPHTGTYAPIAKDGDGTLTVSEAGTINNALFIREGKVIINASHGAAVGTHFSKDSWGNLRIGNIENGNFVFESGKYTSPINQTMITGTNSGLHWMEDREGNKLEASWGGYLQDGFIPLTVSGRNAAFEIDGAYVDIHSWGAAMGVGGADGNGSMVMKNGATLDNWNGYSFFIGYPGYKEETMGTQLGFMNGHATTATPDGDSRDAADRYEGIYSTAVNGSGKIFGKGEVLLTDSSTLICGRLGGGLYIAEGELTVEKGSYVYAGSAVFGRKEGGTSVVNVTSGSLLEIDGQLIFCNEDKTAGHVTIDNAVLKTNKTTFLGYYGEYESESTITLKNNAIAKLGGLHIGSTTGKNSSSFTIGSGCSLRGLDGSTGVTVDVYYGTLDNTGNIIANDVYLNKGSHVVNTGTSQAAGTISASSVEIREGGSLSTSVEYASISADSMMLNSGGSLTLTNVGRQTETTVHIDEISISAGASLVIDCIGNTSAALISSETATLENGINIVLNLDDSYEDDSLNITLIESSIRAFGGAEVNLSLNSLLWEASDIQWITTPREDSDGGYSSYRVVANLTKNEKVEIGDGSIIETPIADTDDKKVTVEVTGDVTLSGANEHSGGTIVTGGNLTLENDKALGTGGIETSGVSSISTGDGVEAVLSGTITNKGELTISGSYDGSKLSEIVTADTRVCVDGKDGNNGFFREGGTALVVVDNKGIATLTVDGNTVVLMGDQSLKLDASGLATEKGLDYSNYHIEDAGHEASMSEIQAMRPDQDAALTISMNGGTLVADTDATDVKATAGTIETKGDVAVGGKLTGATSVVVGEGTTTLSGDNSYMGYTSISGENSKLIVGSDKALGASKVQLHNKGKLDLNGKAVGNYINVTGCELHNASAYTGSMDVSGNLTICGSNATADVVNMVKGGSIAASANESLTVNAVTVSGGDSTIDADLVINPDGSVVLNNGSKLNVKRSLTLGNGTTIVLNGGNYSKDDVILTSADTTAPAGGEVTLSYGRGTYVLNGNDIILTAVFNQNYADALTVSNWGIATASRAMVNAVRGQRSNTGCIADGKGTAWVASLGSKHEINGSDINISGAAVGADMQVGRNSRIGIALGYVEGEVQPSGLRQVDQEGSYIAAYGEHGLKKLSSTSCLSMDWVAAYGVTDSEGAGQKWEQDSVQLNSRVNWNKKVNDKLCMSVFGGLEYFANNSDTVDGVKTGSIQNLRGEIGVGARYVAWGTPAVTDGKSGLVLAKGCEKLVLNGEIRYMNDMVRSNPVIRMEGLSGMGENPGRQGMGIEAGATYRIGERWSASANYGFNTMEDSKEHRVNVGAAYTF